MDILPLALGLLASALLVVLSLAKGQRAISLASIALSTVLIGQYLALEQPLAAALSGLSLLYGALVFLALHRGGKLQQLLDSTRGRLGLLAAYSLLFAVLNGGIALDLNLLAYLGSTLMVAVLMVDSPWLSKLLLCSAGVCWTVFQFQTGAYGNLIGQLFYFGGLGWSSWQLWKKSRSPLDLARSERALIVA